MGARQAPCIRALKLARRSPRPSAPNSEALCAGPGSARAEPAQSRGAIASLNS